LRQIIAQAERAKRQGGAQSSAFMLSPQIQGQFATQMSRAQREMEAMAKCPRIGKSSDHCRSLRGLST
jgi:molecular chaperone DnaK (HSP70)